MIMMAMDNNNINNINTNTNTNNNTNINNINKMKVSSNDSDAACSQYHQQYHCCYEEEEDEKEKNVQSTADTGNTSPIIPSLLILSSLCPYPLLSPLPALSPSSLPLALSLPLSLPLSFLLSLCPLSYLSLPSLCPLSASLCLLSALSTQSCSTAHRKAIAIKSVVDLFSKMLRHTHAPVHYFQNGINCCCLLLVCFLSCIPSHSHCFVDIINLANFLHESKSHFCASTEHAIADQFQKVSDQPTIHLSFFFLSSAFGHLSTLFIDHSPNFNHP